VLERVRQSLRYDPVRRHVDRRPHGPLVALDPNVDGELEAAHARSEIVQLAEARLRSQVVGVALLAQEAEQTVKLHDRLTA
jgi:hypothetical protein